MPSVFVLTFFIYLMGHPFLVGAQENKSKNIIQNQKPIIALELSGSFSEKLEKKKIIQNYFKKTFDQDVEVKTYSSKNEIIKAIESSEVMFARSSSQAYAKIWLNKKSKIKALAGELNKSGNLGYRSIVVVRAKSRYEGLGHLRGARVAFSSKDSLSGFKVPKHFLRKFGARVNTYFKKLVFTGSDHQSISELMRNRVDAAVIRWNSERDSILSQMVLNGEIESRSWRVLWKSSVVPEKSWIVRRDVMKLEKGKLSELFYKSLTEMPLKSPGAWRALTSGASAGIRKVNHNDYREMVQIIKKEQI
jgi:phosphate/phosphite/phosphonate ABC transporter binding protein